MAEALKDQFFQKAFLISLGDDMKKVYPPFNTKTFLSECDGDKWNEASLTQRMRLITLAMGKQLPDDYAQGIDILLQVYKNYNGFEGMVFPDFIQTFGLDHYDISLDALERFTSYSSSEFAIRPFIMKEEQKTMSKLLLWSKSRNHHVRRLASEGCRPRLPWAMALPKFKKDPSPIFPILENLMNDDSEYVRKSVANNLNDITKDNPEIVLGFLAAYKQSDSKYTQWIIKQALRSLIKKGDNKTMQLLGYKTANVELSAFNVSSDKLRINDVLQFTFDLKNLDGRSQDLIVDYIVHFMKANGSTAPKVFKLANCIIKPDEQLSFSGRVRFTQMTTRKHYPGKHLIEVQVNGKNLGGRGFELIE